MKRLVVKVLYHPDNRAGFSIYQYILINDILWRLEAELFYQCFIDQKFPDGIGWQNISPCYQVNAKYRQIIIIGLFCIYFKCFRAWPVIITYISAMIGFRGRCFITE